MIQDQQLALAVQLHDEETFDNYVGKTNEQVVEDLKRFVNSSGSDINSFYLFGSDSVGKSHLINASATYANELGKTALCLSLKELVQMSTEVLDGLENLDVICLDDLHVLADYEDWQQGVFDLFNRVMEQGKKILLTGNNTPTQLNLSLPDLVSRLSWGSLAQVKALSDDEKIQALADRANKRGMVFQPEAMSFLTNRYSRDMSKLIECLNTLDKLSIQSQRKITIPFIKDAIDSID